MMFPSTYSNTREQQEKQKGVTNGIGDGTMKEIYKRYRASMDECNAGWEKGEGAAEDAKYDSEKKIRSGDLEIQTGHRIVKQNENQALRNQ